MRMATPAARTRRACFQVMRFLLALPCGVTTPSQTRGATCLSIVMVSSDVLDLVQGVGRSEGGSPMATAATAQGCTEMVYSLCIAQGGDGL